MKSMAIFFFLFALVALVQGFQGPLVVSRLAMTTTRHFLSNNNNSNNNFGSQQQQEQEWEYNQQGQEEEEEYNEEEYWEEDDDDEYKETTWDRLTGPKLFKSVTRWQGIHAVPLVPLRILTGLLMIHHGSEGGVMPANLGTEPFQGFVDYIVKPYFGFLPGPAELWAAIHDYIEFYGGIFLVLGFLTRPVALCLLGTMLSAVYFHVSSVGTQGFPWGHVPSYSYDFEEPTLYALIFLLFWFNGAGPLSVDSILYSIIGNQDEEEEEEEYDE